MPAWHRVGTNGPMRWPSLASEACPPNNVGHMDMVVYLVETGGIRTLIWGDNRHNPPQEFWDAIGQVDVLTFRLTDRAYPQL